LKATCFKIGLGMVAAISLYAGDQADRPNQITRVVRADPRTGKLVRSVIVTAKPVGRHRVAEALVQPLPVVPSAPDAPVAAPLPGSTGINEAVELIAASQRLPPQLVHSVIKVESNYNPWAVSPKGAQGLMQLMPGTARRFGVANAFDPIDNIQGGTRYLKYLVDLYNNDYRLALAAYNAGEGAVEKYGSVPPYAETENYLIRINQQLQKSLPARSPIPESKPALSPVMEVKPDGPAHIQEVLGPDGAVRYVSR
jgi:soluble lytic murein transglycosylase-like protein